MISILKTDLTFACKDLKEKIKNSDDPNVIRELNMEIAKINNALAKEIEQLSKYHPGNRR